MVAVMVDTSHFGTSMPYAPREESIPSIKPTPEQGLSSNRAVLPARVIAALGLQSELAVSSKPWR